MRELGYPDFVVETWYGIFAPAGTPRADRGQDQRRARQHPARSRRSSAQLARQGMNPVGGTPERLGSYVKEDLARWKRVVEETRPEAGIAQLGGRHRAC